MRSMIRFRSRFAATCLVLVATLALTSCESPTTSGLVTGTSESTAPPTTSITPTTGPTTGSTTQPSETTGTTAQTTTTETTSAPTEPTQPARTVEQYFPLTPDVFARYSGTGNEYVPMTVYVDYSRPGQVQLAYDNGGTEIHVLYGVGNGKVQILQELPELYVREDLAQLPPLSNGEILLMEPLEVGTTWNVEHGIRAITAIDVPVDTEAGAFNAIEVTTTSSDVVTKHYYARGFGLVQMTAQDGYEIHQELAERQLNASRSQRLTVYYPRMTQTDIEIVAKEVTVEMKTNTGIREILDRFFRSAAQAFPKRTYTVKPHDTLWSIALYQLGDGQKYKDIAALNGIPAPYTIKPGQIVVLESDTNLPALMSPQTVIHSIHLQQDRGIVAIDFSRSLVTDMNAGSGFEAALVRSIVNAVGHAYDVPNVQVTLDGDPYESGHIALAPGESFTVDYQGVIVVN
ncbi:MAG: LysM peptidoglycan-binding domain-containing protein [Clostridia bacterium]|nr:LysM peptidoglycan-binding domain-containing protein [Clostridia bacterium]